VVYCKIIQTELDGKRLFPIYPINEFVFTNDYSIKRKLLAHELAYYNKYDVLIKVNFINIKNGRVFKARRKDQYSWTLGSNKNISMIDILDNKELNLKDARELLAEYI